jgi:hypothetical protein
MKRLTVLFVFAFLLLTAAASSLRATGIASVTVVSGAGNGVFPSGASFNGIPLSGSVFGKGLEVYSSGAGTGDFYTTLTGTSLLGRPQYITLNGAVSEGSANADGSVTFAGTASLDLGDGTVPTSVPFRVTTTTAGLTLVIGATTLPTQTVTPASITIN